MDFNNNFLKAKDVPVWMFLRWIPQLLANVDSEKVFAVADIIEKIAVKYPQAIMYPYRLSKENYFLANANTETLELIARYFNLFSCFSLSSPNYFQTGRTPSKRRFSKFIFKSTFLCQHASKHITILFK